MKISFPYNIMITLYGRPMTKKNNKRIIRLGNRTMMISSKQYLSWQEKALWELKKQWKKGTITGDVRLIVNFYIKGKYHVDLDNLVTSVCDLLQDARIINDDDQITNIVCAKTNGHDEWRTDIVINDDK